MNTLMLFFVCVGLCAVGSAFIVLLPVVGKTLSIVFTVVFAEQTFARLRGKRPGSDMDDHSTDLSAARSPAAAAPTPSADEVAPATAG